MWPFRPWKAPHVHDQKGIILAHIIATLFPPFTDSGLNCDVPDVSDSENRWTSNAISTREPDRGPRVLGQNDVEETLLVLGDLTANMSDRKVWATLVTNPGYMPGAVTQH